MLIKVILDGVPHGTPLAPVRSVHLSEPRLHLPIPSIPFTLPGSPGILKVSFDLQRYGTWRELEFLITTGSKKLSIRSIRVTGFSDTLTLQTMLDSSGFSTPPPTLPAFP